MLKVRKKSLMLPRKKAVPQALGRRLRLLGIQAILFESARDRGHACLVVFLENTRGGITWGSPIPL
jgi:hypothetical protein